MMSIADKAKRIKQAVIDFEESNKSPSDYLELMVETVACTNQGDGMTWAEVEEVLRDVLADNDSVCGVCGNKDTLICGHDGSVSPNDYERQEFNTRKADE